MGFRFFTYFLEEISAEVQALSFSGLSNSRRQGYFCCLGYSRYVPTPLEENINSDITVTGLHFTLQYRNEYSSVESEQCSADKQHLNNVGFNIDSKFFVHNVVSVLCAC